MTKRKIGYIVAPMRNRKIYEIKFIRIVYMREIILKTLDVMKGNLIMIHTRGTIQNLGIMKVSKQPRACVVHVSILMTELTNLMRRNHT
jgi:hypothetical protein